MRFLRAALSISLALVLMLPSAAVGAVAPSCVQATETSQAATTSAAATAADSASDSGATSAAAAATTSATTAITTTAGAGASGASQIAVTASDSTTSTKTNNPSTTKTVRVGWFISDLFQEGGPGEQKSGYAYDYLHHIASYASWQYEYVYGDWAVLYDKLCSGEIDVMAGMSVSEERESVMLFPNEPMETDEYFLYKHSFDSSIKSNDTSTFTGKKIGALENNRIATFAEEWVASKNVQAEIVYFSTFDALHEAFENGEIDLEPRTADGASDYAGITAAVSLGEEPSYLAVSAFRPDLLNDLNEAVSCMTSVEPYIMQQLQYNVYGTSQTSRTLTNIEQEWLNQHPVIRVGYIDNYLPYCTTDKNGQATGLLTDVMGALFEELEIENVPQIEYVAYTNYHAVVEALNAGEIDLGFPVSNNAWTLEQDSISASVNVVSDRGVLFYNNSCTTDTIQRIAAKENNVIQDEYTSMVYPNAEIVYYQNIDECLAAVLSGEVDATIMDALRVQYVTSRSKYQSLQYVQLNNVTGKCLGLDEGNKALLMLVNRGLKVLGTSFGYDRSFQYVDQLYSHDILSFIRSHIVGAVAVTCCVIALIVALSVLYIRKQRHELAVKEKLKRQAEEANEAKSRFLFNMSHDIRTPMNAVLGFNELMLKEINNPEKLKEYLEKSKFSGEYLLGLINNVLEIARIDSGKESLNEGFADLKDESYYIVFENDAHAKNLSVTRTVEVVHRYVYTDAQKIREILLNLLSNAVKYTPNGGSIRLHLKELSYNEQSGYATYACSVSDTGIGMTQEFQEKIFDTFARERNTTESQIMGTGLGMAIVKKMVDLMGGTIEVQSQPGVGSTFTVTMQFKVVENPEAYLEKEQEAEAESTYSLEGLRLLAAEDNELNAEILVALLEGLGAAVEIAHDGVECVDMLQSHAAGYYDLILMDIQMPRLNGYDAARKIRALADAEKANIPIVAMTANAFDEDKKNAFDAGMNGHVAKPLNVEVLTETLKALLG